MLKIACFNSPSPDQSSPLNERKKHHAVLFSPGEYHTHPMVIPIQKNPDSNGRRAVGNKGLWYEKVKDPPFRVGIFHTFINSFTHPTTIGKTFCS